MHLVRRSSVVFLTIVLLGTALTTSAATALNGAATTETSISGPQMFCMGVPVTIFGTSGHDVIRGTGGDDVIHAQEGWDIVYGYGGNDMICGGPGRDDLYGGNGNDALFGGDGADRVQGGMGNDLLTGGYGADQTFGNMGLDSCYGYGQAGSCENVERGDRGVRLTPPNMADAPDLTQPPTTRAPTTQAPTTQAPTTQAPTTQAPTTQAPTTQAPATDAPTTQAPTTQAPTTQPPSETCDHTPDENLVPACGAFFGATNRTSNRLSLLEQEAVLGQDFGAVRLYKVGDANFFNTQETRFHDEGRTLVVSWKVNDDEDPSNPDWQRIANGEFDDLIRRVARDIRDGDRRILFSLHHEPEDNVPVSGSNADYRAMFRHVHSIMEPIAGDQLVWFVNFRGWSNGPATQVEAMYPGDDVLDWISWNPYNWWGCHQTADWLTFEQQAQWFYDWAQTNHPDKPLMIGETAATEDPSQPGRKAQWIRDMAENLQTDYPQVKGLIWFQHTVGSGFCDRDWTTTSSSISAIRSIARDPYFGGEG